MDASDPADVKAGNALQDGGKIEAASTGRYRHPNYDEDSYEGVCKLLLPPGNYMPDSAGMFGARDSVHSIRHMLRAAFGWGGLPEQDAYSLNVVPNLPVREYQIAVKDVPVDAFWSVSRYNKDGHFEENAQNA